MSTQLLWLPLIVGTTHPETQFFRKSLYPSVQKFGTDAERCGPGVVVSIRHSTVFWSFSIGGREDQSETGELADPRWSL